MRPALSLKRASLAISGASSTTRKADQSFSLEAPMVIQPSLVSKAW